MKNLSMNLVSESNNGLRNVTLIPWYSLNIDLINLVFKIKINV